MLEKIYKELTDKNFTSLGTNNINHSDIVKTFERKESNHYAEIYKESYGFSIMLYGDGFMNGYFPHRIDITNTKDIKQLNLKLSNIVSHGKD